MSRISELVKNLRLYKKEYDAQPYGREVMGTSELLEEAAKTIETLSAKLQGKIISTHGESFYDEMRKELKRSIINLSEDHYNLSEFMRVIDEVFVKYRNKFENLQETE